ncbi:MAG: hypothetical protein BWY76_02731 [bacterium ADurb.Bin429]|nr:MAG: hypothetical protein BWY76_02731 [bacterium ADurb.Bin429]
MEDCGLLRVNGGVGVHARVPLRFRSRAFVRVAAHVRQHVIRHIKSGLSRPAQPLFGGLRVFGAQRFAMHLAGAFFRTAVSDDGAADDERGARGFPLRGADGCFHRRDVVAVNGAEYLPAVGAEAGAHVFAEGDVGVAFNGDFVVIVEVNESAESQRARQAGGFGGDTFLQVAVGDERVNEVVHNLMLRRVIPAREPVGGDGHAHAVGKALTEGTGGHLHARGEFGLRMAGRFAAKLAERL